MRGSKRKQLFWLAQKKTMKFRELKLLYKKAPGFRESLAGCTLKGLHILKEREKYAKDRSPIPLRHYDEETDAPIHLLQRRLDSP